MFPRVSWTLYDNLWFYDASNIDTSYDKNTEEYTLARIIDVFFFRGGLDWSLVEINKAISLSGLTLLLISLGDFLDVNREEAFKISMLQIIAHSVYSLFKYYQFSFQKILREVQIKQISILLGLCSQCLLYLGYFEFVSGTILVVGFIILSLSHFWTMKVDDKYQLQVRPWGYLPFYLGFAVLGYHCFAGLMSYEFLLDNDED